MQLATKVQHSAVYVPQQAATASVAVIVSGHSGWSMRIDHVAHFHHHVAEQWVKQPGIAYRLYLPVQFQMPFG